MPKTTRKQPQPPLVSEVFARRLREARGVRNMTQEHLAKKVRDLGVAMTQPTLAKIEKGKREARLDEAVAIAAVLDVALVNLVVPIEGDKVLHDKVSGGNRERKGPPVRLAPHLRVEQVKARRWMRGEMPLNSKNYRTYAEQSPDDIALRTDELSDAQRKELWEEAERFMRTHGVQIATEPAPTKQARSKAKPKEI